jgi:hypothetical protein
MASSPQSCRAETTYQKVMAALTSTPQTAVLSSPISEISRTAIINPSLPSCYAFTTHYDWASLLFQQTSDHIDQSMVPLERLTSLLSHLDIDMISPIGIDDRKNGIKSQRRGEIINNIGYIYLHGLFGTPVQ